MPLIALVFSCAGKRTGLAIRSEELAPADWQKLQGNLKKEFVRGGGMAHLVSKKGWAHNVTYNGRATRAPFSPPHLTGELLNVDEPTIEKLLAAIDADEVERQKVPLAYIDRQDRKVEPQAKIQNHLIAA